MLSDPINSARSPCLTSLPLQSKSQSPPAIINAHLGCKLIESRASGSCCLEHPALLGLPGYLGPIQPHQICPQQPSAQPTASSLHAQAKLPTPAPVSLSTRLGATAAHFDMAQVTGKWPPALACTSDAPPPSNLFIHL